MEFNKKDEGAHYDAYRPIIYGAIINRAYSSWETFSKELFYEYFLLKRQEFIENNTFIKRYKIHELPAYLLENLVFDSENETFNLKINKDLLVFTSKNIELKELNNLFSKIDIQIQRHIEKSDELKQFVEEKALPLSNDRMEKNVSRALKYVITERNRTAHNSAIDDYFDIPILEDWVTFFEKLGFVVYEKVLLFYFENIVKDNRKYIGDCQRASSENSLCCFDINEEISINKESTIFVFKGETDDDDLVDILTPESFMVEDEIKEFVEGLDKAGCKIKSMLYENPNVKKHYKYYIC
nr:HEPN domain-containing protein [Neobacillus sp. Marseille-Q6967]